MNNLYIVDALGYLFRSYYAIRNMTNLKGESTNALFGFIRSIQKIIKDFSPEHLVVVFDGKESSKQRKELFADYKSHRKGMPEDLVSQLHLALQFCEDAKWPHLSLNGVEADDAIGAIALWAAKKNATTYICSTDKDLCQLVTDHIFLINTYKDNLLIDKKKVQELYGVTPEQIVDYLALIGDASDNIPGVKGMGPKTASALLNEFESLEKIYAHLDRIESEKKRELLRSERENAFLSQKLATLHVDLPIPQHEEFYQLKDPDVKKLSEFYHQMHFLSLLKELEKQSPPTEKTPVSPYTVEILEDLASLEHLVQKLLHQKEICVDTETTSLDPLDAKLVGIGFCCDGTKARYIPCLAKLGLEQILATLQPLFQSQVQFYGHHIKYDMHVFYNYGIALNQICFDTFLASYLLSPEKSRHNLDILTLEHFNVVKIPIEQLISDGKKQRSMCEVPIEHVAAYCGEDLIYTYRLKCLFEKQLKERHLTALFDTLELPLICVLMDMERHGMKIDLPYMESLSRYLKEKLHHLEKTIYELAGCSFNIKSPAQLADVLFDRLKLVSPSKKRSTNAEVLESLSLEHPVIEKILEFRTLEKLRSTYTDALLKQTSQATARIHCTFNQAGTTTGRLSCQNPNLQNIPIRSEEGLKIRRAFIPEGKDWSFLSADYSQIELRLLAHLSEDFQLIKAFQQGQDIHAVTASQVFDIPLADVTAALRSQAKAVNFGIIYGQQAYGLSKQLGIPLKEAALFIDTYFEKYPGVKKYLHACKEHAAHKGYSLTMFGRQRPIPDIHSKNKMLHSQAERLAVNSPLQGSQADIIKKAMIEIHAKLKLAPELGYMVMQIHDELLFEVPDSQTLKLKKLVHETMENVVLLKVPLIVNITIGKNWSEC